jgi:predicted Rossmann fold flavoprotein
VVLASGGKSYPACGTAGDGYAWAAALGHRIVAPHEALTPVTSHAPWVTALKGVTLPDVLVRVIFPKPVGSALRGVPELERRAATRERHKGRSPKDAEPASARGSMLFAHFGVTGPAVLDISRAVSGFPKPGSLVLRCDLVPDATEQQLEAQILEAVAASGRRRAATLLDPWLPHRVGLAVLGLAGIPPDRPAAELSKVERRRLARTVKQFDVPAAGTMGFRKAEVTAGGVALEEVDSHSMQSRLVPNLYFAGELLDLDGPVGGYNFQAAFSTGWLAGQKVC